MESSGEGRTCVLIATKNGEATIGQTIRAAARQANVYVVSDGSTDSTPNVAEAAGAVVMHLKVNVGKPNALREAFDWFHLGSRYDSIVIMDDDTVVDDHFVELLRSRLTEGVAAVCGETRSDDQHESRWNWLCAGRALAYWRYGLFIKSGQNAMNCITVLPGSNTMFAIDVFDDLVHEPVTVIVDDTQWLLEIQTRKLGKVTYERRAVARIQDPTNFGEFYKQMKRWMGGTFQGVRRWRVGRTRSWFSLAYSALLFDWALYVFVWPVLTVYFAMRALDAGNLGWFVGAYLLGYAAWATIGAIVLRRWRLIPLMPLLIVFDWLQRVIFVHALIWSIRNPTSECKWDSPTRIATKGGNRR